MYAQPNAGIALSLQERLKREQHRCHVQAHEGNALEIASPVTRVAARCEYALPKYRDLSTRLQYDSGIFLSVIFKRCL